jgi:hypothetical protein
MASHFNETLPRPSIRAISARSRYAEIVRYSAAHANASLAPLLPCAALRNLHGSSWYDTTAKWAIICPLVGNGLHTPTLHSHNFAWNEQNSKLARRMHTGYHPIQSFHTMEPLP